jgi:predicted HTH transcriptional regulator
LEAIAENPSISRKEPAEKLSVKEATVLSTLRILKNEELIRRHGAAKGGYWEVVE